jgi:hypothetical protein
MKDNVGKKNLTIEWRHLEVGGETCDRCAGTYGNILDAITELEKDHQVEGVLVEIIDTALSQDRLGESNMVLINGVPIEQLLSAEVQYTECSSCSDLIGSAACCRAVTTGETTAGTLPVEMIRTAILRVLYPDRKTPRT